jgi:hypothetical protein
LMLYLEKILHWNLIYRASQEIYIVLIVVNV